MTIKEALDYEVAGSWWACYAWTSLLQKLTSEWFMWKVKRKYTRYQRFMSNRRMTRKIIL